MRIIGMAAILGALIGCTAVESGSVPTSGMYANWTVRASGDGTSQAIAVLRQGGELSYTFVELSGDDALEAEVGGTAAPLLREEVAGYVRYVATVEADPPDAEWMLGLHRTLDGGAPASTASLPEPFEQIDLEGRTFSRGGHSLGVRWSPSGKADPIRVTLDGECVRVHQEWVTDDTGVLALPAGTLIGSGEGTDTCPLTILVERLRFGELDPGFGQGGEVVAVQIRRQEIVSAP